METLVQSVITFWPFVLMAVIFYFMLYKPQKKEQAKRKEMLDGLKKGNKVITVGGMYGVITAVGDTKITLKIAENIEVDFVKSAVNQVVVGK